MPTSTLNTIISLILIILAIAPVIYSESISYSGETITYYSFIADKGVLAPLNITDLYYIISPISLTVYDVNGDLYIALPSGTIYYHASKSKLLELGLTPQEYTVATTLIHSFLYTIINDVLHISASTTDYISGITTKRASTSPDPSTFTLFSSNYNSFLSIRPVDVTIIATISKFITWSTNQHP
jgi:hypothetical protein